MMGKMIIGFDAKRIVRNRTGLGSYGRTLVNDLAQRDDLLLRLYAPDAGHDDLRRQVSERDNLCYCYPNSTSLTYRLLPLTSIRKNYWRSRDIVSQLQRDGVQLYHGLSGELPIGIRRSGIKSVVTIHDLIFMRHPEFYHWIDTKIYERKFRQTVREADHIIAISECTKRDIMELGDVDESRISVVYQSCSPRFSVSVAPNRIAEVRHKYGLTGPFILSVGSIEQRKNIGLAIRALSCLPEHIHLVAVGKSTDYSKKMLKEAWRLGLGQRVHMLHGVSDNNLNVLYHEAETFVYPSVYEGFGIPIIEAISSGLPVVACTGSCLEEAGGPDSLYVAPHDVQGMAASILQTLHGTTGREERILRSQEYIRRFEGSDVAAQVAGIYQRLLG
jgi:glycosyltransferase involved in cell wall biosynthesis